MLKMMKETSRFDLSITHIPMRALTWVYVSWRVYTLTLEKSSMLLNCGWISVLLGALMAAPAVLSVYGIMKNGSVPIAPCVKEAYGGRIFALFCILFSFMFALEAAFVLKTLSENAGFSADYGINDRILLIPAAAAVIYAAIKGGNGAGGAAILWIKVAPLFLFIVLIGCLGNADIRYLTPVLGPGIELIAAGALETAFCFMTIPVSFMIETGYAVKTKNEKTYAKPESILRLYLSCIAVPVLLTLIHAMMYPAFPHDGMNGIVLQKVLPVFGKSERGMQLPVMILWFSSAVVSGIYLVYSAGRLLMSALGKDSPLCFLAMGILALSQAYLFFDNAKHETLIHIASAIVFSSVWTAALVLLLLKRKKGGLFL